MADAATPATTRPDGPDWPWYRSPFTWAFVIGIIVLTVLRPCMRHVPEAPASLGAAPALVYHMWDTPGAAVGLPEADGTVWVVQLLPSGPCAACDEATAGLASQLNRLQRSDGPFRLLTLVVPDTLLGNEEPATDAAAAAAERLWRAHGVEAADLWSFGVITTLAPWPVESLSRGLHARGEAASEWTEFLQLGRVWIMDGAGEVRGLYAPGEGDGALETFHRIFHVLRESGATFRQAS